MFPFLQTNITSQMWPSGGKGEFLPEMGKVGYFFSDKTDEMVLKVRR